MREITGTIKESSSKSTRAKGEHTIIIMPDGEPKVFGPGVRVVSGNPNVKVFVGSPAEIEAEKAKADERYASIKAAKKAEKQAARSAAQGAARAGAAQKKK